MKYPYHAVCLECLTLYEGESHECSNCYSQKVVHVDEYSKEQFEKMIELIQELIS